MHHVVRKKGKACVAESRNRMKDGGIKSLEERKFFAPMNRQQNRSNDFCNYGEKKNAFNQSEYIFSGRMGKHVLQDHALPKRNASSEQSE